MAFSTGGNQVFFGILAATAAEVNMMDVEIAAAPTELAPPSIASQDFPGQRGVLLCLEAKRPVFSELRHQAVRLIPSRNCSCWAPDRKLKNRRSERTSISGSPFSRFAPARKSAQIISRQ